MVVSFTIVIASETENTGMNHCEIGKKLDDLDRKVKSFREEQRNETSKVWAEV